MKPRSLAVFATSAVLSALACGDGSSTSTPPGSGETTLADARALARHDRRLDARLSAHDGYAETASGTSRFATRGALRPAVDTLAARAPDRADGPLVVSAGIPSRGLSLELSAMDARSVPGELHDGHVVYGGAHPDTDVVVSGAELSTEISYVLRSDRAPRTFRYRVAGSALQRPSRERNGGIAFLGDDGRPRLRILPPYAVDADGLRREATLALEGDELRVTLDTRGLAYPVLLDPAMETVVWQKLNDETPPVRPKARDWGGMAYDEARGVTVLFGGLAAPDVLGDTWEWDGAVWTQKSPAHTPTARWMAGMVYDAERKRVVLHAGTSIVDQSAQDNETWTWDGNDWTQASSMADTGPMPPHRLATFVYDRTRKVSVLAGGFTTAAEFRSWSFDGTSWTELPVAPLFKQQPIAFWDPTSGDVLFQGGNNQSGWQSSTLRWNGTSWATGSPVDTTIGGAAAAVDLVGKKVLSFGGFMPSLGVTRSWDGTSWTQLPIQSPPHRGNQNMVYDVGRKKIVLFGGHDAVGTPLDDTWEYDPTEGHWTERNVAPPISVVDKLAYDSKRKQMMLALGWAKDVAKDGRLYVHDGHGWGRPLPKTTERTICLDGAFGYDPEHDQTIWAGGEDGNGVCLDTWIWKNGDWQKSAPLNAARVGTNMAWDPAKKLMILPFGRTNSPLDTLEWNGSSWTSKNASTANAGHGFGLAYDHANGKIVRQSGDNFAGVTTVTATYEGTSWSPQFFSGAPFLRYGGLASDPNAKRLIWFGGDAAGPVSGETFTWGGSGAWTQVAVSGPPQRHLVDLAWDVDRHRAMTTHGYDTVNAITGEVWVFSSTVSGCNVTAECPSGLTCVDGVCCNTGCGGGVPDDCVSCKGADTGEPDGFCAPVKNGASCGGSGVCSFGACDGGGGAGGAAGAGGSGTAGSGTAGTGTAGTGTAGTGTAGTGTAGTGTAGTGTAGTGTAGTGTAGSGTAGTAGSGTAGSTTAGTAGSSSGAAGSGTGGSGTAGSAGSGTAGSGTAGSAGSGTAGSGTAGSAGSGTAGSGTAGSGVAGAAGSGKDPLDAVLGDATEDGGGCGCDVGGDRQAGVGGLALLGLALVRRRREATRARGGRAS